MLLYVVDIFNFWVLCLTKISFTIERMEGIFLSNFGFRKDPPMHLETNLKRKIFHSTKWLLNSESFPKTLVENETRKFSKTAVKRKLETHSA